MPHEAKLLQEAARAVLSGTSLQGVTRDWDRQGLKTRAGIGGLPRSVRRTLLSPRNAGLITHRGIEAGTASGEPVIPRTTGRYDHGRNNLDRHRSYVLATRYGVRQED